MTDDKAVGGRPTKYTEELADEIIAAIQQTRHGLQVLSEEHLHWPSARTIWRWLAEDESFCQRYLRAKEMQSHLIIDEVLDIADQATDKDNATAIRVRVDARFRLAGKLCPKKYGDRIDLGNAGEAPFNVMRQIYKLNESS